ncbi:MAG: cysteine desulfurase family protein [Myxococcales bacterium]
MRPIYLDFNATTPLAPQVLEAMVPYLQEHFGNPSSGHVYGQRAKEGVERARGQLAVLLGCEAGEIVFTGGGTEANNLAIFGAVEANGFKRLVTSTVEHPAVENPCRALEKHGVEVVRVPVTSRGQVDPQAVARVLAGGARALVSVMHANNETGALQPIAEIARVAHAHGALVHTDAAQSVGKVSARIDELGVDLLSVAGHKLYAPKGVGALYVRAGTPLAPFARGAGHEHGMRPGTENVASIAGLGAAAELAFRDPPAHLLGTLARRLLDGLRAQIPGLWLNGPEAERLPNTVNVSVPGRLGRDWLAAAPEIAASLGSACHEGHDEPSSVLLAMGLTRERALGALRLSVGRTTTEAEIDTAVAALARASRG